jgi:hypothetical protein
MRLGGPRAGLNDVEKILDTTWIRTPIHRSSSPLPYAILTTLSRILHLLGNIFVCCEIINEWIFEYPGMMVISWLVASIINNPSLGPTLCRINSVHTLTSSFLKIGFNAILRSTTSFRPLSFHYPNFVCICSWFDHSDNDLHVLAKGTNKQTNKLHGLSPRANYTDHATVACRRSDCQLLQIEGATWSAWRISRPYSRFSRQEPLLFYQVAPQLYSRGWVDPVPDPLLTKGTDCGTLLCTLNLRSSWGWIFRTVFWKMWRHNLNIRVHVIASLISHYPSSSYILFIGSKHCVPC